MDRRPDADAMSTLLSRGLDILIGTKEEVNIRRKIILIKDYLLGGDRNHSNYVSTGSFADGFSIIGSDTDMMCVSSKVKVICPETHTAAPSGGHDTTSVLIMREAGSRPGYVTLELVHRGQPTEALKSAMVPKENVIMISSDIYRQYHVEAYSSQGGLTLESNGPCHSVRNDNVHVNVDIAESFPCHTWPAVADEWAHRLRIHEWPDPVLIDKVIRSGCHLLPVGDKTSPDTFLQWRISFVTAERLLIHSLGHLQFKVYGLLKYFLKYIRTPLRSICADDDILCSYFMKILILHVSETTPQSLWQDKNTKVCFVVCLRLVIDWVKSGNCPHYFIQSNNLFKRNIHGENRRKLLDVVIHFHDKQCLSFLHQMCTSVQHPSALDHVVMESKRDQVLFTECGGHINFISGSMERIHKSTKLMLAAQSETDLFGTYYAAVYMLSVTGRGIYPAHVFFPNNKTRYAVLRMCKNFLSFFESMCSAPLQLATFFFLVGSFRKAMSICEDTMLSHNGTVWINSEKDLAKYQRLFCGRGYTLFQKFKAKQSVVLFQRDMLDFSLPHIRLEVEYNPFAVLIPQLVYAVFLSFLCYHELGMVSKRDDALRQLIVLKYDADHGGERHWIVYTLLGVCYASIGDKRRAIRCYFDSYRVQQEFNPALVRIESLRSTL